MVYIRYGLAVFSGKGEKKEVKDNSMQADSSKLPDEIYNIDSTLEQHCENFNNMISKYINLGSTGLKEQEK